MSNSQFIKSNDGVYVKKEHIHKIKMINNVKINNEPIKLETPTKKIRIKMLCNWCSSKQLCIEWNNLTKGDFTWNNIQFTWENENIDYYIIINKPSIIITSFNFSEYDSLE